MSKNVFLRIETKPGEELTGTIASESGLTTLLDNLYNTLSLDEAVEIHVYREYVLVGTRKKGHGDVMTKKFINFGFSPTKHSKKSEALSFAIRAIDDGGLPDYCYRAINGDLEALRLTTEHLVRAYDAKVRRMKDKGKPASEIEAFALRRDAAKRRLTLEDEEFMEVSEPIILEIPRDPATFYSEEDVFISDIDDDFARVMAAREFE
ncbi:MAG: hypothetical protein Q4E70_02530 [Candidatus Saccharibacteria bacterium]|nr:hypothetical protein [Candidatus Saccharibacteria bacterium]